MLLHEPGDERRREDDACDEDREHELPQVGVELPSAFRRYALLRGDDLNSGSFSAMPEIIRPSGSHQTAPGGRSSGATASFAGGATERRHSLASLPRSQAFGGNSLAYGLRQTSNSWNGCVEFSAER